MKLLILFFSFFFLNSILAFGTNEIVFINGDVFLYEKDILKNIKIDEKFNNILNKRIKIGSKKSKLILNIGNEVEIRANENSEILLKGKNILKIFNGKVWIQKLKTANDFEVIFNNKKYFLKYGSFNFDKEKNLFIIFNGIAFDINGNEIQKNKEHLKFDNWIDENLEREKINIAFVINNKAHNIKEIINDNLKNNYFIKNINYFENQEAVNESDLVITCNINFTSNDLKISAIINDAVSRDVLNLISIERSITDEKEDFKTSFDILANYLIKYIEDDYVRQIIKKGRKIVIEAEVNSEEEIEKLENYIKKIQSIKDIKKTIFYKKKVVFMFDFKGVGFDIVEILKQKKEIKIWKYSKNIVKLNFIKQ